MDTVHNSTGETRLANEHAKETCTRAFVLWDLKGIHVFLRKPKCVVRKKYIHSNHESLSCKTVKKSKENGNPVYQPGKLNNLNLVERIKGLVMDRLVTTCSSIPSAQEQQSMKKEEMYRSTLDGAALISAYLKTGTLNISERNVFEVFKMAFELKMIDVYNACLLFLSHSLTIGNCIKIWRLSKQFNSCTLNEQVLRFMEQHIARCFMGRDQISVAGSLVNSDKDVHNLEFLLQFFSSQKYQDKKKTKGSMVGLFAYLMKQDSMIWRCYFKEYLEHLEKMKNDHGTYKLKETLKHNPNIITTKGKKKNRTAIATCTMNEIPPSTEGLRNKEFDKLIHTSSTKNGKVIGISYDKNANYELEKSFKNKIGIQNITTDNKCIESLSSRISKGILVTGGIKNDNTLEALNVVFLYEPEKNTWTRLPSLNHARFNHSMVKLQSKIYVLGGRGKSNHETAAGNVRKRKDAAQHDIVRKKFFKTHENSYVRISSNNPFGFYSLKDSPESCGLEQNQMSSVEFFSIESDKWSEASSMILLRREHSSVVVRDFIYVIGGHDGVTQLCSIEKYDPSKDEWMLEDPMSQLCTGMSVVTDERFLYVIGGYSGNTFLNTLFCYDTINKTWVNNNFPNMKKGRAFAGAELVDEDIFVFGGINGDRYLEECDVFNLTNKTWRNGPQMNQPRCNAGHCVSQTNIFVFGGESDGKLLDTAEYLDIANWEWKMVDKMPIKTAGLRCVLCT